MEVYRNLDAGTTADRPGPASFRRQIAAVKDAVRIEDVAAGYGEFRLAGAGRLLGRCVSPEHEDRTPSMTVYTDAQRFRCYGLGCGAYGDVLDLVMLAEPGMELWETIIALSTRYGVALPERPSSWFGKQTRQRPIRDRIEAQRIEHVRLLVFRLLWMPWLRRLPESVRQEATESAWTDSLGVAEDLYSRRMGA